MALAPDPPPAAGGSGLTIPSNRPQTLLVHGTLLLAAMAAVFLVAGPQQGSLGVFLAGAGAVMILCPPRVRVDWRLWAAAGGIVASGALAFLPARWFPVAPWRSALEGVAAIPLPESITPMPWETGFWLAIVAISALVGLFALAHPLRTAGLVGLASLAVAGCAVFTVLAIYLKQTGWQVLNTAGPAFGLFPNRNHTASFLVVGSILAMGLMRLAWRDGRWAVGLLAGGGLALFVAGLGYFSASRGGVVFLVVGTVIWVAGLGRQGRSGPLLVSLAILLVAGGGLFVVSGSEVRNRLLPAWNDAGAQAPATMQNPASDLRVAIYADTAGLIREAPLTGIGLGTFVAVFPQYRQRSLGEATALHPESDWLMLAAEAGLPAAVCAGTLGWLLLRRCRRWHSHPSWPLRWACAAAVMAACLHGAVDVPLHRVVLGWWVLVVAGVGLHGGWSADTGVSRVQHAFFVVGGVAALTFGASLIRAQWFGAAPLPPFAQVHTQEEVLRLFRAGDTPAAIRLLETRLRADPLTGAFYHQLGTLLAQSPQADTAVDRAFLAQRLISPNDPTVPFEQGNDWILNDTGRTAALWREALARRERLDRAQGIGEEKSLELYGQMLSKATEFSELQQALLDWKWPQPAYVLPWLAQADAEVRRANIAHFSQDHEFHMRLDEAGKKRLLTILYEKGESGALNDLTNLPAWQTASERIKIRQLQDQGRFEQLVRTLSGQYGIDLRLPEEDTGNASRSVMTEQESSDPVVAFATYWRRGNQLSARRVLDEAAHQDAGRVVPQEVWRLKASLAAYDGSWPEAWQALATYLRQRGDWE